jgi:hypothetical protein
MIDVLVGLAGLVGLAWYVMVKRWDADVRREIARLKAEADDASR